MATLALPSSPASPLVRPSWPRWRWWAIGFAAWTLPGLAALSYYYLNQVVTAQPMAWTYALVSTLPWWYTWALLTPVVVMLARRFPLERGAWPQRLALIHVPAMLGLLAVHAAVSLLTFRVAGLHEAMNLTLYEVHFTTRMHVNALAYFTLVAAVQAFAYYRAMQRKERQAARLEVQLAEAQLRALKMQLNPHFLFNTLHSVSTLVRKQDNATAVTMLGRLGAFLRLALENQGTQEIPLDQELDFLERYLEIEKVRFQDRLTVEMNVDPDTRDLYVPNLVLQPVVENAIHHGIAPKPDAGRIELHARRDGDRLVLRIRDDGAGLPGADAPRWGVGLSNTASRLAQLYGDAHEFQLQNADGGGLEVRIVLPAYTASIAPALPDPNAP